MGIYKFDPDPDPHFRFLCEHGASWLWKVLSEIWKTSSLWIKMYQSIFNLSKRAASIRLWLRRSHKSMHSANQFVTLSNTNEWLTVNRTVNKPLNQLEKLDNIKLCTINYAINVILGTVKIVSLHSHFDINNYSRMCWRLTWASISVSLYALYH